MKLFAAAARSLCALAAIPFMLTAAWAPPRVIGESSPSGRYVVRVIPGAMPVKPDAPCMAEVYEFDAEGQLYRRVAAYRLKCKVAPVMVAVVDDPPRLVTYDEWFGPRGSEHVAIYDLASGAPILRQTIKDLLPESVYKALPGHDESLVWYVDKPSQSGQQVMTSTAGVSPLLRGRSHEDLQVVIDVKEAKVTFSWTLPGKFED